MKSRMDVDRRAGGKTDKPTDKQTGDRQADRQTGG
jgi:hypothetical protein